MSLVPYLGCLLELCLHPGTPSFFASVLPSLPLSYFEPCKAGHLHHHHQQFINIVLITFLLEFRPQTDY
jgi:hypothetical protein